MALQGRRSFETPVGKPAWANDSIYHGRREYIQCTLDNALPYEAQQDMLVYSGVEWDVKILEVGHCPFVSRHGN